MIIVSHARRCETTGKSQSRVGVFIQINKASRLPYKAVLAGLAARLANVLTSIYYYLSGRTVPLSLIHLETMDLCTGRARFLSTPPSVPRQQITLRAVILNVT